MILVTLPFDKEKLRLIKIFDNTLVFIFQMARTQVDTV